MRRGREKIASAKPRKRSNTEVDEDAESSVSNQKQPRGCRRRTVAGRGFCLYCAEGLENRCRAMPIFSQLIFRAVHCAARRGFREEENVSTEAKKLAARR